MCSYGLIKIYYNTFVENSQKTFFLNFASKQTLKNKKIFFRKYFKPTA